MPQKIGLGSVVRKKGEGRYMGVQHVASDGLTATCAWLESGKVLRTGSFAVDELEVVPAMGADEFLWHEAFRAASSR
jgi:hypothetical protein